MLLVSVSSDHTTTLPEPGVHAVPAVRRVSTCCKAVLLFGVPCQLWLLCSAMFFAVPFEAFAVRYEPFAEPIRVPFETLAVLFEPFPVPF